MHAQISNSSKSQYLKMPITVRMVCETHASVCFGFAKFIEPNLHIMIEVTKLLFGAKQLFRMA
jgi:D-alanyl-lipoteichoic acid acyltransferase DltB (MBOAT superfamily)